MRLSSVPRLCLRTWLALAAVTLVVTSCAPPATPDTLVYIAEGGTKYHRKECRLKRGSHGIRLGDLPARYSPCKVCDPPVLARK